MSVTGSAINAAIPTNVDTIPPLPASKITSGQFSAERIPDLDAGKTTTGIFPIARGGTGANNAADARNNLGLGNVSNVTVNDQTPTYTTAITLTNLTSGEKLSIAFGKIAKAITDLITHIGNKNNPHEVTAAQAGAAAASHTHNASDINAGTLSSDRLPTVPIAKGGTGATTAANARTNLGITPANIGAAAASHTHNASDINAGTLSSDRLPTVPITKGGTGATSASAARTNLGITPANIGAARLHVGSYVGTGTYGSNNPNSLTFPFVPQLILISDKYTFMSEYGNDDGFGTNTVFFGLGATSSYFRCEYEYESGTRTGKDHIYITWVNNTTINWYANSSDTYIAGKAAAQLNTQGKTYYYWIIG